MSRVNEGDIGIDVGTTHPTADDHVGMNDWTVLNDKNEQSTVLNMDIGSTDVCYMYTHMHTRERKRERTQTTLHCVTYPCMGGYV